ncbi:protein-L-isoaspartate O-methyltransferase family protein [Methylobacterium oryzihabitans]|uniref:Protein-L-isoaspartate O-methyltransferase n=1 Tax=Methylobacterium oryzihabitans TaxID=2499852 RepID=A0A3S2VK61_9HYPH|nr:protein-L-isoaspartate O-methyltransferase [Methylobacterium oryzihabitans]RVU14740.1 protein-L-isoaspartate O-methyltransferase [Methylobacterium oryzihabitans]
MRSPAPPAIDPAAGDDPDAVEAASFVLALRARGVRDPAVLGALERVPREAFVLPEHRALARRDLALPLPCGQTMTAPSTVAAMLTALLPLAGARILEVGTGSGYVTALLVRLGGAEIVSLERYATLSEDARDRLDAADLLGSTVTLAVADGCAPAQDPAPYDRILVNGALLSLPQALLARLAPGGRLVGALMGEGGTRLIVVERDAEGRFHRRLEGRLPLGRLTPGRAAAL